MLFWTATVIFEVLQIITANNDAAERSSSELQNRESDGPGRRHRHHHHLPSYFNDLDDIRAVEIEGFYKVNELPETFRPSDNADWSACKTLFDDVALSSTRCGDCWATAAASSTAQRLCIRTKQPIQLSSSYFLNCRRFDEGENACRGGNTEKMDETMRGGMVSGSLSVGVVDGCVPYQFQLCKKEGEPGCPPGEEYYWVKTGHCPTECTNPSGQVKFEIYAKESSLYGINTRESIKLMKETIYNSGPVMVNMFIGPKLHKFLKKNKEGVFKDDERPKKGGTNHIAVVQGWQKYKDIEYWLVMGDWGRNAGDKGYINIPTGKNINLVESDVFAVWIPDGDHTWSEKARIHLDLTVDGKERTCFSILGGRKCPSGYEPHSFVKRMRPLACFCPLCEEVLFLKKYVNSKIPAGHFYVERELMIPVHCVRPTSVTSG